VKKLLKVYILYGHIFKFYVSVGYYIIISTLMNNFSQTQFKQPVASRSEIDNRLIAGIIYRCFLAAVFCLLITTGLYAQNVPLAILPFELKSDNRIYLKCQVNGSDSLVFMFDTGAEPMVINESILGKKLSMTFDGEVNNIGTNGTSKIKQSSKNKFSFGGILTDSVSFVAIPYGDVPFDGVLGSTFMKKYIIEINYKERKMSFYDPKIYRYDDKTYEKIKIQFSNQLPTVEGFIIINGKKYKGKYEMDTGSDDGLTMSTPFTSKYNLIAKFKAVAHATSLGSDGTKNKSPIVVLPEIGIAGKHFYAVPATLSTANSGVANYKNLSGMFGNGFLKRFDMIIDLSHNQIFIRPNNLVHTPYYDFLVK